MPELIDVFPLLTPIEAEQIEYEFRQWMEINGEQFVDYEHRWCALVGFAAGYQLQQQKERSHDVKA